MLAEIDYCVENEFVTSPEDFLNRRVRIGFLDQNLYRDCVVTVSNRMQTLFDWDNEQRQVAESRALEYYQGFMDFDGQNKRRQNQ